LSRDRSFIRGTDPYDSITYVWDVYSGKQLFQIRDDGSDINAVGFSNDGKYAASIGAHISVWDMSTGKLLYQTEGGTEVVFGPANKNMAITQKRKVKIFNMRINDLITELKGYSNSLVKAEFSTDSKKLLTLSNEKSVKLWNIPSARIIRVFEDSSVIHDASLSPDGKSILLLTEDKIVKIADLQTAKELVRLNSFCNAASFSADGKSIITANTDSTVSIWDARTGKSSFRLHEDYRMSEVGMSNDGSYLYYVFGGSAVAVADLRSGKVYKDYLGEENIVRCRFSPDSRYFFVLGQDGTARIFENTTGNKIEDLGQRSDGEFGVTYIGGYYYENLWRSDFTHFSPDGKWLIIRPYLNRYAVLRRMSDLAVVDTIYNNEQLIRNTAFIPGKDQFITGSEDNKIRIWQKTGVHFKVIKEFTGNGFKISPDGNWLVIINNVLLQFYDLRSNQFKAKGLAVGEGGYFMQLNDQSYYTSSKDALQKLLFRSDDQYISFEQFDIQYNRPDLLLMAMGNKNADLIRSYQKAYTKRLKKSGIDPLSFSRYLSIPEAEIIERENITYLQDNEQLKIRIKGSDNRNYLERFNIWVNGVPIYGQNGIMLSKKVKTIDTSLAIHLSDGLNQIEVSVTNMAGTESYRNPLLVHYTGSDIRSKTWFIGIGIDRFADNKYDLSYSVKDIRDLALQFKSMYGESLQIDTLFNEKVNINTILSLKADLLQAGVDDKVIIAYSGHGLLDKDLNYYLSTWDVDFHNPARNGLAYEELENLLDGIQSRKKLLLIDACHSGEVDKESELKIDAAALALNLKKGVKPVAYEENNSHVGIQNSFELMQELFVTIGNRTGAVIIAAAAGNQFALESGDLDNGVFTYSLLEGLRSDPHIKISDLKKQVSHRVEQRTNGLQRPVYRNEALTIDWNF